MKSKRGESPEGKPFDPESLPEHSADHESRPRPAPAPGVPVSDEVYRRLKEEAEHGPAPDVDAQEDRSSR